LRVRLQSRVLDAVALASTGFETLSPQIPLPVKAAERFGLRSHCNISVEVEVLLSGELTGKLVVVSETPGEDLWGFRDESALRRSGRPELWI